MENEQVNESGEFAGLPPAASESDNSAIETNQDSENHNENGAEKQARNEYRERLDLSNLPEEIRVPVEGRINHLTKLMGNQERKFTRQLSEYEQIMQQQFDRIEELTNGFGTMVNQLQDQTYADTEAALKQQIRSAIEVGDVDKQIELQDKLIDLKAEKKLAAKQPQQQQKTQPQKPQQQEYGYDISEDDQQVITAWQDERDETGNLLRPWAHCKTPDNPLADKQYAGALRETYSVLGNPRYANWTMEQKMAEVDRRMGVVQVQRKQSVMGGGLTGNRKNSKLALSPDAEKIALRMKLAGPGATKEQHLEKYRKQLEATRGSR